MAPHYMLNKQVVVRTNEGTTVHTPSLTIIKPCNFPEKLHLGVGELTRNMLYSSFIALMAFQLMTKKKKDRKKESMSKLTLVITVHIL